jgi:hypothetical protein
VLDEQAGGTRLERKARPSQALNTLSFRCSVPGEVRPKITGFCFSKFFLRSKFFVLSWFFIHLVELIVFFSDYVGRVFLEEK